MRDLTSTAWILAKGLLFLLLVLACAGLLYLERPEARTALLLAVLVWSSARFYYFLFYVLERYVDPELRYAGLLSLVRTAWLRRRRPAQPDEPVK